ncbi:hypothetical protein [Heyndrickxia acidicola]|uniref:Uncharacterized protein n=1 Tax=Heyndrickxia acidicola TaxID=209389 RepID=A0ABU6MN35_9BACI|nr:hypothetical protein [Heyndrickxia acidicola]MED1206096.1 hypothetical protein [Heyndrickxia acidicola]
MREQNRNLIEEDLNLDIEVYDVSSTTVLETIGASVGKNSCSIVMTGP